MESLRYYVALLAWVTVPPAIAFWLWIHPLAHVWRRLGPRVTYWLGLVGMALVGGAIFWYRDSLLRVDYGFSKPLAVLAIPFALASLGLEVMCRRHLGLAILVGLPEVSPDTHPPRLLTKGIYARVRHPRYLGFILALIAMALFANHLSLYLLLFTGLPAIYLLVVVEERELRQRFGAAYEDYCRQVPRLVPRRISRRSRSGETAGQ